MARFPTGVSGVKMKMSAGSLLSLESACPSQLIPAGRAQQDCGSEASVPCWMLARGLSLLLRAPVFLLTWSPPSANQR